MAFGIPVFGITALLWGMLASEILLSAMHLISLRRNVDFSWNAWSMIVKPAAILLLSCGLLAAVLSLPAAAIFGQLHPFLAAAVKIGFLAVCYGGFLLLFHKKEGAENLE